MLLFATYSTLTRSASTLENLASGISPHISTINCEISAEPPSDSTSVQILIKKRSICLSFMVTSIRSDK